MCGNYDIVVVVWYVCEVVLYVSEEVSGLCVMVDVLLCDICELVVGVVSME